ncbi:MAG: 3-deoxy-manno-octulosonate cytidylyltransferase [Bdellovibrionales bacterium]|nr:3-deoxy-manno-octulosonate cytidylyltransferase [Bdellovibrionales bacterium]
MSPPRRAVDRSSIVAVIPARYASERLPAKPLSDLLGKPMVQHVYDRAKASVRVGRVIVATDDERIRQAVLRFGGECLMTDPALPSGTDRVAAVAREIPGEVFVNVQGDEPCLEPEVIDRAVACVTEGGFDIGTAATGLLNLEELRASSVVKVLLNREGAAMYFSRFPIPYSRQTPEEGGAGEIVPLRHLGIYVYRRETLLRFASLPPTQLERAESLEQLRALEHGLRIGVARVESRSRGVDTPEDLDQVRKLLLRNQDRGGGK